MTFTQPEQRVFTGARGVRLGRAGPMKAAAIIAALGIALIFTMGPAPASAQTTVVRECGGQYTVARYNSDGSAIGVWNKQLSDEGTIYTAGKTWLLVEGDNGQPDRFVSDGGVLQVGPCDATRGAGTRQVQGTQSSTTLVSNTGVTTGVGASPFSSDFAQAFTTGSNSTGYTLTSVELNLKAGGPPEATYTVAIHVDSSAAPAATSLGTLTTTTTALTNTLSLVQFNASGNGISLTAGTTYWVVIDVSSGGFSPESGVTTSGDEDSGAADGWSMANTHFWRTWSIKAGWPNTEQRAVQVRINGYAAPLPANFDCNAHLGWEYPNGRQWDSADRVWRQVGSYFFTGQYANTGDPICERRFSSAGSGTYAEKLGYGYTLCSLAPTWQTVDPETGEAVGGPARVHKTGHLTSSGQEICSDFDGLRSTKKYIQEQQLKQFCMRSENAGHALCK